MIKKISFTILLILFSSTMFWGCSFNISQKLGFGNSDFEYIKDGKVKKIVFRNTRDRGFTFVITDQNKIKSLYSLFSDAGESKNKTSLDPDYTIEIYEQQDIVHKFNYIIGLSKSRGGNFYDDNKFYNVSSRLDDDLFGYFEDVRKPVDFNVVYYNTITKTLDRYKKDVNKDQKVTWNIRDDVDVQRYLLTVDLEDFKKSVNGILNVVNETTDEGEVIIKIDTIGFINTIDDRDVMSKYKAIVTFIDSSSGKMTKYWVLNNYSNGKWSYQIKDKTEMTNTKSTTPEEDKKFRAEFDL